MRRIPAYLTFAGLGLLMFAFGLLSILAVDNQPMPLVPTVSAMLTQMPLDIVLTQLANMGYSIPASAQATAQFMLQQGMPADVVIAKLLAPNSGGTGDNNSNSPTSVPSAPIPAVQPTIDVLIPTVVIPTAVQVEPLPTAMVIISQPTAVASDIIPTTESGDSAVNPTLEVSLLPMSSKQIPQPTAVVPEIVPTRKSHDRMNNPTLEVTMLPTAIDSTPQPTAVAPEIVPTTESGDATTVPTEESSDTSIVPTIQVDSPTSIAVGNIAGKVSYADADSAVGINLKLTRPDGTLLEVPVGADGSFAFSGMQPGLYILDAVAKGYLSTRAQFTLDADQTLQLPQAALVAGDTNGDDVIDLLDAALIASNFDSPVIVPEADLNHDGLVDVLDLTLVGNQFGMSGPLEWK